MSRRCSTTELRDCRGAEEAAKDTGRGFSGQGNGATHRGHNPFRPIRHVTITYRALWRWHFHAGLFCIPFVLVLALTGSIYLFKPQIDAFADRGVDSLQLTGTRATGEQHIAAALASLPGSKLFVYEIPLEPDDAVRVHRLFARRHRPHRLRASGNPGDPEGRAAHAPPHRDRAHDPRRIVRRPHRRDAHRARRELGHRHARSPASICGGHARPAARRACSIHACATASACSGATCTR